VEVHRNGDWFSKMSFQDVMRLGSQYTVARLLERDDFQKRFAAQQPIGIHELFYPLMQGYDSVAIRADVEIGGTEQKFNLLVGRVLQELHEMPAQIVLTLPILPGLDGVTRMSKSLGNYVGVNDAPSDMFGKIMSLPDASMPLFWHLVADRTDDESRTIEKELGLASGWLDGPANIHDGAAKPTVNPMIVKKRLAHRLVSMYHGGDAADRAQSDFEQQFSRKGVPDNIVEWTAPEADEMGIKDLLVQSQLAPTGSAAWRLVDQGAVSVDGAKITDRNHRQRVTGPFVLRVGRKMLRVVPAGGVSGA
jgi:tyrosyl-tRNA synthetase